MKWELYGYQYKNFYRLVRAIIIRQICSLRGHPRAKFYAATGVEPIENTSNANIGVTFVCPDCHKSWAGDVKAGFLRIESLDPKSLKKFKREWNKQYKGIPSKEE